MNNLNNNFAILRLKYDTLIKLKNPFVLHLS